jgi:putative inorganic carbon (hco3(-)) transporter
MKYKSPSCFLKVVGKHKALISVFVALIVLSILPYFQIAELHDSQRVISSLMFPLGLILSLWFTALSMKLLWGITGVFLWGMLAVWISPMPSWSSLEFSMLFSVAVLSVSLFQKVDAALIKQFAMILALIQAFYISQNLMYYIVIMMTSKILISESLATGFSNIRFYAQFLIWTVPFVLGVLAMYPKLVFEMQYC